MSNSKNIEAKVLDSTYYSIGFPEKQWDKLIIRDNYISQIVDCFSNDTKIIFLEGEEDSGKTVLCAQFTKRNIENTISVFFNPLNILDYKIEFYCSNVVAQIKHILSDDSSSIEREVFISIEEYRHYMLQLRKFLKKGIGNIFLVIDGIEDKVKDDKDFIKELFEILPIGQDNFRIIISGNQQEFTTICPKLKKEILKPISLLGFSTDEITKYLGITATVDNEIKELFKITKGFPGRLNTLKRLIENDNYSLDKIDKSTNYKNWLELDCNGVDLNTSIINGVFSLLSLSENSYTIDEISKVCSLEIDYTEELLSRYAIIEITDRNVCFVSNAHKKYFANILRGNKSKIVELRIRYLANIDTINSKYELTKLYAEKKEWPKIVDIIDEDYLKNILESTGTLQRVNDSLELGVLASKSMDKFVEMWRYSIQGSIVNELDNYLFWESEIKARISIRDFMGAISLSESAILKVDRLRLLALIARKQKEYSNIVDEELIRLIQELYKTTDLSSVGEKIYDIVADLIYAIPNLAIEMIEKSSGSVSEKNINDWVIAKLSIAAIDSSLKEDENADKTRKLEAVQSINHVSVRKINRAISFLVGNYSSEKVIEEVTKLSDSTERLRLLRLWLNNNHSNNKDIEKVINLALDELVSSSSESTVTLDVLKDLSFQLPYVKDKETKENIYNRFKTIENTLTDLGLTKNKYIYNLNMFHTEFSLNEANSIRTINSIINEIDSISDTLIKLESFAEVYAKLKILHNTELEIKNKFVYSRILILTDELYRTTANHFEISQFLLKTIGNKNPVLGLKICEQINTVFRRERARLLVLDSYLDNNLKYVNIDLLKIIESSFEYTQSRQTAYVRILERYSDAKKLHYAIIQSLFYYTNKINLIEDISDRLTAYIYAYKIIAKNSDWKTRLSSNFEKFLYDTWNTIEADWDRIDNGFRICFEISKINELFSKKIFKECVEIKNNSWLDSRLVAYTYLNSVKLIIRAYTGLLISKNEAPKDFEIIGDLLKRIPSEIERLNLWTEVGINAFLSNNEALAKKILDTNILPLIEGLIHKSINLEPVLNSLTFIHIYNPNLAIEFLDNVSIDLKENVCSKICDFYVYKRNPFEVYDSKMNKYLSTYNYLTKAISLLELINTDSTLYFKLDNICKAIKDSRESLSKPQISALIEKLESIIPKKLPDPKNIKHQGFKVLANMKITLLGKELSNPQQYWLNLIEEVDNIPNISDAVFVKSFLIECLPFEKIKNGIDYKAKLFDEIISSLNSFKIHFEFVQRVIDISDTMYKIDRNKWKIIVNRAFKISNQLENGAEVYNSQKNIIDSMYRLDPAYAKELIKLVDKDNKGNKLGSLLNTHFEYLEIANKIKENEVLGKKDIENYRLIVRGVYKNLCELNSNIIGSKKISEISNYLPIGNKLPLHEVFPVYMYYLNNCAKTYSEKKLEGSVSNLHRENFVEAVKSTNIIELLSQRRKFSEKSFRNFFIDEDFVSNKAIKPGTRDEALAFVKTWLQDELEEFIIIADPYFVKEDLEILKIIKELKINVEINILGSEDGNKPNIEEDYINYWKKISNELPPFTNITFCWVPEDNNNKPIHDRWLITKSSGLRLGTSFHSLGKKKESEISIMKQNEAMNILESTVKEYVGRKKREINNLRISYKAFSI
ncbi:MAG: hypothetical protein FD166_888 [Bacteroidetes bacterium]|nr:MAG: hypothetical protein FD166_888 [Bacteroidota bacterium]